MIFNNIPLILQYFLPGAWCILLYGFIMSKEYKYNNNYIFFSCIISYILLSLVSLLRIYIFYSFPDTALINSALGILLGTCSIIFLTILTQRNWFKKIISLLFHKTISNDIWRESINFKNGSNLKIYLTGKDYYIIGHFKYIEEKGDDSWIALSAFAKFDQKTNNNYKNEPNYLEHENVTIVLRLSDIEHIEIF